MTLVIYAVVTVLVATCFLVGFWFFIRAYARYRDSRIIVCPESGDAAMVEVDAAHAALTSALGQPQVRLQNCTRWPVHQACGQECLLQLDVAPEECLIQGVMSRWYQSKSCVICGKKLEEVHLFDHKPALVSPEGELLTWSDLGGKDLLALLSTYEPVCWDCYIAQSFALEHPELVTYRPWRPSMHRAP